MRIVASIQARMGSSRFPGKVLSLLGGTPALEWQVERLRMSRTLDDVVVATTIEPQDDAIEEFCRNRGVRVFRGDEDDVLQRVTDLVTEYMVDIHVECFGDSPFVDPQVLDGLVRYFIEHKNEIDCASSAVETSFPPGMEVIVYSSDAIRKTNRLVGRRDLMREHAGFNITRFPQDLRVASITAPPHLAAPELFLELDEPLDLVVLDFVATEFLRRGEKHFTLGQILELSKEHPDVFALNRDLNRRWTALRNGSPSS